MKRKTLIVIGLVGIISISGCGGCSKNEASTEPTEVVMETETESNDATKLHDSESVSDSTIVEESTNGSLDVDITEDNKLFDPDKVTMNANGVFSFKDQATIDYLMGISGVSELPEEQLNQFMSDIAEMVAIGEFNGDVGKIEDYIQTVLPVYQQQSSTTKNNSNSTDTKTNNNSSSTKSNTANTNQETQAPSTNESTPSNNTDNNISQSESQDINNNQVGPMDHIFGQDDPADWGEYDSNAPSANWQY